MAAKIAIGILLALAAFALWQRRFIVGVLTYGRQTQRGSLQVGDEAPNVQLVDRTDLKRVELSSYLGDRPLVLIFGSFT